MFVRIGKREPIRPNGLKNIGEMVRTGASCRAMCTKCGGWRDVDLPRLVTVIGPNAILWDKRVRCRFDEDCDGANRFFYLQGGRYVGMWS